MALTPINFSDYGYYKGPHPSRYGSRVWLGAFGSFAVSRINAYWWNCRLSGHSSHKIVIVKFGDAVYADCDCYDFQHYGDSYRRACAHIWRIYFFEDIAEL